MTVESSSPETTAITPGICLATEASMPLIFACACGERSTCSHSAPSSGLSSMNCPFPVSNRWSSRRLTGLPAPKRRLPGRMFISLSFESFEPLGGVLADFEGETTKAVVLLFVIPGRATARTRNLARVISGFRVCTLRRIPE